MNDLRGELERAGAERQAARARTAELSGQIAQLARQAVAAGVGKSEIARLAQISRPALDTMLDDGGG